MSDQNNVYNNADVPAYCDEKVTHFFHTQETSPDLEPLCSQLADFAQYFVKGDPGNESFGWDAFLQAINRLPGTTITFDTLDSTIVYQANANDVTIAGVAKDYLDQMFGVCIDQQILMQKINAAFAQPQETNSGVFPNYPTETSKVNPGSSYGTIYATPDPGKRERELPFVLVTIEPMIDLTTKSRWLGWKSMVSTNYAAKILGVRLLVDESFRAPPHSDFKPLKSKTSPRMTEAQPQPSYYGVSSLSLVPCSLS